MERKMTNLGRAKKKLRYFQNEENSQCHVKIKDVFTMHDLDNIFDDLDSGPGTPLFSPLPKTPGLDEQVSGSNSGEMKPPLMFTEDISPLKASDALVAEIDIHTEHLNGSPLDVIAPITTSSPIELLTVEVVTSERPDTTPLLFMEDEEPVGGDLMTPTSNHGSESPHEILQGEGDSVVSPPAQLACVNPTKDDDRPEPRESDSESLVPHVEIIKPTEQDNVPVTSDGESLVSPPARIELKKPPKQDPISESSAAPPEFTEQKNISPTREEITSVSSSVSDQNSPPVPATEEKAISQAAELGLEVEGKEPSFQQKLFNALQLRMKSCRSQPPKCQRDDPAPLAPEDDFMILDDDAPIRFVIPKKGKALHAKKGTPNVESASPERIEEQQKAEDKADTAKQDKKKRRGKTPDIGTKEGVASTDTERRAETLTDTGEEDGTAHDAPRVTEKRKKKVLAGMQKTNTEQLGPKRRQAGRDAFIKTSTPIKPRAKLPTNGQEEPAEIIKKKPHKAKAAVKESSPESEPASTAKPKKRNPKHRAVSRNTQGGVDEILDRTQPPQLEESPVQPESPSTTTGVMVEKITKHPVTKPSTSKKPARGKKLARAKEASKIKELPVPESDVSTEASQTSKRPRKPPGDWWLAQEHRGASQHPRDLQSDKDVSRKDSTERHSPRPSQKSPKKAHKPESIQEPSRNLKKPRAHSKTSRGRRRAQPGAPNLHQVMPEETTGDDPAAEQPSPVPQGSPGWHTSTPGDKRLFAKTHSRDSASESAQKRPPGPEPEPLPEKRQRRAPSNWWEIVEAPEPARRSPSPRPRPPVGSRLHTAPNNQKRGNNKPIVKTPKSFKRSLASFDALLASAEPGSLASGDQRGRRLLHSLEDQSEQSSENLPIDEQPGRRKTNARFSTGSNRAYNETAFRSGPSSMIELERFEERDPADLPSTRARSGPRFLSDCDMCAPPLKPVTLEVEDWDSICVWFDHLWPTVSKNGQAISANDFHWHCHAGRAMGHMIDLQADTFTSGKILLGSFMKKPEQVDRRAVTVFNVHSSCVRVEMEGITQVYNAGCTFMTPRGTPYSIHNMCREPAVLWYHRMLSVQM